MLELVVILNTELRLARYLRETQATRERADNSGKDRGRTKHRYGKWLSNSEAQDMVGGMMEMKKAGRVFISGRGPGEGTTEEFGLA